MMRLAPTILRRLHVSITIPIPITVMGIMAMLMTTRGVQASAGIITLAIKASA